MLTWQHPKLNLFKTFQEGRQKEADGEGRVRVRFVKGCVGSAQSSLNKEGFVHSLC